MGFIESSLPKQRKRPLTRSRKGLTMNMSKIALVSIFGAASGMAFAGTTQKAAGTKLSCPVKLT